jgi:hypothetical protein
VGTEVVETGVGGGVTREEYWTKDR